MAYKESRGESTGEDGTGWWLAIRQTSYWDGKKKAKVIVYYPLDIRRRALEMGGQAEEEGSKEEDFKEKDDAEEGMNAEEETEEEGTEVDSAEEVGGRGTHSTYWWIRKKRNKVKIYLNKIQEV